MKILLAICFIFLVNCSLAQTTIQGVVKDQKGETIPGVNIFLKGTFEGTSSEIDGTYILETGRRKELLLWSSIYGIQIPGI
jgi:hypothetical protein